MKAIKSLIIFIFCLCVSLNCAAFSLDTYATESKLASGHWVKVAVKESGLYCITPSQLRQWGFSDPSAVRIYGYGALPIPEHFTLSNYVDDLPLVQIETTSKGIVFYAQGPETLKMSSSQVLYPDANIYTLYGYYFLTDSSADPREIPSQGDTNSSLTSASSYNEILFHEIDRTSVGEVGHVLVGENFRNSASQSFKFKASAPGSGKIECTFVSDYANPAKANIFVNGEEVSNQSNNLTAAPQNSYQHGVYSIASYPFSTSSSDITVNINVPLASAMKECWLDYIAINISQPLSLPSAGYICFQSTSANGEMAMVDPALNALRVWDVTQPNFVTSLNYSVADGLVKWSNDYHGQRQYAIWHPEASLPSPIFVEKVANQNLHAMQPVDMVIISPKPFVQQAQRLAQFHASAKQPLSVAVVDPEQVYNEFGSGSPDPMALRRFFKMLYDRQDLSDSASILKYALLMGRASTDNRMLTAQFDNTKTRVTLPWRMTSTRASQQNDNTAFGNDDILAMLKDNSGINLGFDDLSIAIGRMPLLTVTEAKNAVDKIIDYVTKSKVGTWRNSHLILADDGNNGVFAEHAEDMAAGLIQGQNSQNFVTKVYVDAYDIIGGSCQEGRNLMYRMLDEGVMWWSYIGHGNPQSWTKEDMLNYTDINNLFLKKVPVLTAITCDFVRWDVSSPSGAEIMFHERYGGTIATISATRPSGITDNGYFAASIGRAIAKRNDDGSIKRVGDIYRYAKNNILNNMGMHISNPNRLMYVLMGDPALPLAMPSSIVRLDSIDGKTVDPETQITLQALQRTQVQGSILSPEGQLLSDYEGTVQVDIYDAEYSISTQGWRNDENKVITYEQHGEKLFSGSAPIKGGKFSLSVAMPGEVADNFRPATMNMCAYSSSVSADAVGVNRDFYVFGFDESAPEDVLAPQIEAMYLNHSSFVEGSTVDTSPMLIADVSDDVAINISSAGIGHQMSLVLDDKYTYNDVSLYFTPSSDGTPSGSIHYPLESLTVGNHRLRLRIWDTSGNSATHEIQFDVAEGIAPTIFDVYTDANPASTEANFYITHDRPDAHLSVTIGVYSLMGRPIWESTVTGRSDMQLSAPVTWDLTDSGGRRVPRGIYVYRATISEANGSTYSTSSRKLAVTGI